MDRSSLLNLKESLQSRNNGINEKKQGFLEAFRKDGMPLGKYPTLLTNEEWNTTKCKAFQVAIERLHGTEAYNKFLSTSLGKFLPDIPDGRAQIATGNSQSEWKGLPYYGSSQKDHDIISTSFLPGQGKKGKGSQPTPPEPTPPPSLESDFAWPDEAAVSAIDDHNPTSRRQNKEYGGNVCEITLNPNNSPRYTYTATPGELDHVYPDDASCPSGTKRVAAWHTHGGKDRRFASERFSTDDINYARENRIPLFVGTPGQQIMVIIPKGVWGAKEDKVLTCPRKSR